jgi:hypothetical protein
VREGASTLLIESRGAREDERDKATILDVLRHTEEAAGLNYSWHPKTEPLLWLADGICGAVREHLLQTTHAHYFERLQADGVFSNIRYLSSSST